MLLAVGYPVVLVLGLEKAGSLSKVRYLRSGF
jgi:hypothetical protein